MVVAAQVAAVAAPQVARVEVTTFATWATVVVEVGLDHMYKSFTCGVAQVGQL